ncbi:hypothetical protein BYT27DRAFT_6607186 [Phlegmacium glaucopus]|nr:hypothetical protein BYT27DRAFT_6607186 [Phlegmacium glaucopus]
MCASEPDPFDAHVNTYYTQTTIPPTQLKGTLKHVRKASMEESLILSLQTQLVLRTELCGHHEADLRALDEEDLQGLNIALDSKQRELELLKRKGTVGSTPAQPSKVSHRRDSSISTATPVLSRLACAISDSGTDAMPKKERNHSSGMPPPSVKPLALGKSTRVNGSGISDSRLMNSQILSIYTSRTE